MTKQEARIIILEHELRQARNTVEFLHGCLTDSHYKYSYPQQTIQHIEEWDKIVPPRSTCFHSVTHRGCYGCEVRNQEMREYHQATELLK